MTKEYTLVLISALLVYVLLIFEPKVVQLKMKKKLRRKYKHCPSKLNPIKFTLVYLIIVTLIYIGFQTNFVKQYFDQSIKQTSSPRYET